METSSCGRKCINTPSQNRRLGDKAIFVLQQDNYILDDEIQAFFKQQKKKIAWYTKNNFMMNFLLPVGVQRS